MIKQLSTRKPVSKILLILSAAVLVGACDGSAKTSAPTKSISDAGQSPKPSLGPDAGQSTDAGQGPDAGGEPGFGLPQKLVVLGDSIVACVEVGGKNSPDCAARILHNHLSTNCVSTIAYDNISVPGAITEDVVENQLGLVSDSIDPILVVVYVGGNDLQPYLSGSDSRAENAYLTLKPQIKEHWGNIFDHFNDRTAYPGGFKLIINQQYNPFDDCTAPSFDPLNHHYNITQRKFELLRMFNADLEEFADSNDNVSIADQYTPFLGHGHHYDLPNCPHYDGNNEYWMIGGFDLVHPNKLGQASIASVWKDIVDELYADCTD